MTGRATALRAESTEGFQHDRVIKGLFVAVWMEGVMGIGRELLGHRGTGTCGPPWKKQVPEPVAWGVCRGLA